MEGNTCVLAGDGLRTEIETIAEKGIKKYEFKDHYGYDYIGGRVKNVAASYVNGRLRRYFAGFKKNTRKCGYSVKGISFRPLFLDDMEPFFTVSSARVNGTDEVTMTVNDMSDRHFRTKAKEMFDEETERQREQGSNAYRPLAYIV